jgi:hypothetical protein
VSSQFIAANSVLIAFQALLVLRTGAGIPRWLERIAGRAWALLLPVSIVFVVAGIALFPELADALTWLALLLVPPGALLALGWAIRGTKPALALLALPLLALAWAETGTLLGDGAAAVLTALSAITLGRLLAGGVPADWLKAAIVAFAVLDAILVFGNQLQAPAAVLNAAVPVQGAPRFQFLELHHASMGYGDMFVAAVFGGVLAAERRRQLPAALLVVGLSAVWDLLFLLDSIRTVPATVPIAAALVILEARRWTVWTRLGISKVS